MVGPVYGVENALTQGQIAVFLASGMLGGVAAQYPVGWIADKTDRRMVLLGLSVIAAASCLGIAYLVTPGNAAAIYLAALRFRRHRLSDLLRLRRLRPTTSPIRISSSN